MYSCFFRCLGMSLSLTHGCPRTVGGIHGPCRHRRRAVSIASAASSSTSSLGAQYVVTFAFSEAGSLPA